MVIMDTVWLLEIPRIRVTSRAKSTIVCGRWWLIKFLIDCYLDIMFYDVIYRFLVELHSVLRLEFDTLL